MVFQKKWEIALALTDPLLREGVPKAPFLWDAGHGQVLAFRQGLTERGSGRRRLFRPPKLPFNAGPDRCRRPEPWERLGGRKA